MICGNKYCGGRLLIIGTKNLPLQNKKLQWATCEKCGESWVLETRILRKAKKRDSNRGQEAAPTKKLSRSGQTPLETP